MTANKDSILLSVLLAFMDQAFQKVVSKNYSVTYLNGATTVFGGLLHGFSTSTDEDTNLIRIVLQISKANQDTPTPANLIFTLPKITGATPTGVPQ
jgi:hypothetical protein